MYLKVTLEIRKLFDGRCAIVQSKFVSFESLKIKFQEVWNDYFSFHFHQASQEAGERRVYVNVPIQNEDKHNRRITRNLITVFIRFQIKGYNVFY